MSSSSPQSMKVAVLGLGVMGGGMAANLLSKGFTVSVWNRSPGKAETLRAAGAQVSATPAEAVAGADLALAMLADDEASRSVWLGPHGALGALARGAIVVECGTLTPGWVGELAAAAAKRGLGFIDAPVSGTKPNAAAGTLRFLAGGDEAILARAEPVLLSMGSQVVRLGPVGSGATFKLINNFLCGVQVASLAEALVMVERSGLEVASAAQALVAGAPGSPLVKMLAERMLGGDYSLNFAPGLMAKDLGYAIEAFAGRGVPLASAEAARSRFLRTARRYPEADMASVIETVRDEDQEGS